jgi:hypothetical protein
VDADVNRGTALAWAAAGGRTAAVRRLLALGADPNAPTTFGGPEHGEGTTALHHAAEDGQLETIEALLDAGADPTLRDAALRRHAGELGRVPPPPRREQATPRARRLRRAQGRAGAG